MYAPPAIPTNLAALRQSFGHMLLFETVAGSHAYGTANAQSDEDLRGIFAVPTAAYLALQAPPAQLADERSDEVYYSLARFLELAAAGNPNILELLFMPADCIRLQSPILDPLFAARQEFVSRACVASHIGYAQGQIKRARGRNKWVNNPQPETPPAKEDYCWVILDPAAARALATDTPGPYRPISLADSGIDLAHYHVAAVEHSQHLYRLYEYGPDAAGVFRGDILACESIPKADEWDRCRGLLIYNETGWSAAQRDHKQYWDWRRNRNDARWQAQESGELDYDAKNMMHTVRLLYSGLSLIRDGRPRVRFDGPDLAFLMAIRNGDFSYDELMARVDDLNAELDDALAACSLPGRPKQARVTALLHEITQAWENQQ